MWWILWPKRMCNCLSRMNEIYLFFHTIYIYIYIYMGSSYTFFKLLDLNRSNGKKKTLINANILIRISLIIPHLLYFISISKPKKKCYIWLSLRFYLYLFLLHRCSTSMDRLLAEEGNKKKKPWNTDIRGFCSYASI